MKLEDLRYLILKNTISCNNQESLEVDPHICDQLIFQKMCQTLIVKAQSIKPLDECIEENPFLE